MEDVEQRFKVIQEQVSELRKAYDFSERRANEISVASAIQIVRQRRFDVTTTELVASLAERVDRISQGVESKSPKEHKSEPQRQQGHDFELSSGVFQELASDGSECSTSLMSDRRSAGRPPCPLGCSSQVEESSQTDVHVLGRALLVTSDVSLADYFQGHLQALLPQAITPFQVLMAAPPNIKEDASTRPSEGLVIQDVTPMEVDSCTTLTKEEHIAVGMTPCLPTPQESQVQEEAAQSMLSNIIRNHNVAGPSAAPSRPRPRRRRGRSRSSSTSSSSSKSKYMRGPAAVPRHAVLGAAGLRAALLDGLLQR